MPKNTNKRRSIWWKAGLLFTLLLILGGVMTVSWAVSEYDRARESTIQQLEEEGKSVPSEEEIEFNPEEAEDEDADEESSSLDYISILLVGVDNDNGAERTDTILLGQYHPSTGDVKMASLMRDMYVDIPGRGRNKINAAFAYGGMELLRQTIKENFDYDVDHYAQVDFDGFEEVVDTLAPDGIEVEVEDRMYYEDRAGDLLIDFDEGEQLMDGEEALQYVRFRADSNNDFGRVARQQQMLQVLQNELLSVSGITQVPALLGSIEPFINTSLSNGRLISYARDFVRNGDSTSFDSITIPEAGGYEYATYSHAGSVLEPDFDSNIELMDEFFALEDSDEESDETAASERHGMRE
ncbi:LCP family protein [Alkalicoccus urumqiensis]|uniref:Regulatory protein MsrR n=1 Tax=Alkalicoccus urumqiensis TaxID=1548213 RepID=A0A2P6MD58_ALKUR|nr:LCP family protein [Alkalicoccus urumqiensis]PRO64214.1 LytR family transcriptional regulator [Alkalicoccus urumqiensis]